MTDAHTDQIEAGRVAWQRLKENGRKNFDDWLAVAKALQVGRDEALAEAGTSKPFGSYYTSAMARWLRQAGLNGITDTERSRALRVLAHLPAILAWRDSLSEAQKRRHNHPHAIWAHWRRSIETGPKKTTKTPRAAQRQPVRVTAAATETGRHGKAKAVYWPQSHLRRASEAMRLSRSSDYLVLARLALQAAVRNEGDLQELLSPDPPPVKKPPRQLAPPAAVELQAAT